MSRTAAIALAVAALAGRAVADDLHGYGELGFAAGTPRPGVFGLLSFAGAFELGARPWWGRIGFAAGPAIDGTAHADAITFRFGVEHRTLRGWWGAYEGLELEAYRSQLGDDRDQTTVLAMFAVPRAGVELGNAYVRARLGIEVPVGIERVRDPSSTIELAIGIRGTASLIVGR